MLVRLRYGRRYLFKVDRLQKMTLGQTLDHDFALCNCSRSIWCARFCGGYIRLERFTRQNFEDLGHRWSLFITRNLQSRSVLTRPRLRSNDFHPYSIMVRLFTSLFDWMISQRVAAHIESKSQTQAQASESLPRLRKHDHLPWKLKVSRKACYYRTTY